MTSPRWAALFRILFVAALVFAVTMALLPKPPALPTDQFGDKFEHMLAFATLTLFAGLGFAPAGLWRRAERLSFLGAMIEVLQSIPALGRDCDIRDWIADTAMVLLVTVILWLVRRRFISSARRNSG